MTTYYLIRHGVTDWIEAGIAQGISDRPLSSFGLEQAQLTGLAFKNSKAHRLFVSPMKRAAQTAQPVCAATGLEPETIDGLRERNQGWFEGKRDLWRLFHKNKLIMALWIPFYHLISSLTGETRIAFQNQVLDAWKYIRSQETDQPVIVVAHSGVLHTILMHELGQELSNFKRFFTNTCSITEIAFDEEGRARLVRLNDTGHLNEKKWD